MDAGRKADLEWIAQRMKVASRSEQEHLEDVARNIMNENGFTRSMRESLIEELRQGRTENVRDIHEYVQAKKERGNWKYT